MKKIACICFVFIVFYARAQETNHSFRVGVYDNSPKIGFTQDSIPYGIFIDVISEIAKELDYTLVFIIGDWDSLYAMLQNGQIDVLPDMAYSDERKRKFIFNSVPVIDSWLEVFTHKDIEVSAIADLQDMSIGVLKGSIQEQFVTQVLTQTFNVECEIVVYTSYTESIEALQKNKVDAIIADRFFYFSDVFLPDFRTTGVIFRPTQLFYAFSKDIDSFYVAQFDKELLALINNGKSKYYQSLYYWLDKPQPSKLSLFYVWLLIVCGIAIFVGFIFIIILRRTVSQKTKELFERNKDLAEAKLKAEGNDRLKSLFLSNMSHEIRTPMNGIIGFIQLLKDPELEKEDMATYIEIIDKSSHRLLRLIDNIIEVSNIDSGNVVVESSSVNIPILVKKVYNSFKAEVESKHIDFSLDVSIPEDMQFVYTDSAKLEKVLQCVIQNAYIFTHTGFIHVACKIKTRPQEIRISVTDSGIGISRDKYEEIFKLFTHADESINSGYDGAGLGLYIAQSYVTLLGGTISLESKQGNGSTFSITLPYKYKYG